MTSDNESVRDFLSSLDTKTVGGPESYGCLSRWVTRHNSRSCFLLRSAGGLSWKDVLYSVTQ
jgi:hypothetical protein